MLRAHRPRLAAAMLTSVLALSGVTAAALMPTPAYADAISNAYNLNGYKIMSDMDTLMQARFNEPASYQPARWDGTRWASQAAYVHDSKAAYIRSLAGYQATPAVANTSHATQMASSTVNGRTVAGASTVLKTEEAAAAASKFKLPAFKATAFVKGAGAVGVATTGLMGGFEIGKAGMTLFGYDYNGLICGSGSDALAALYGSDCPGSVPFAPQFVPNSDASGTLTLQACNADGSQCASFAGQAIWDDDGWGRGALCANATGYNPSNGSDFRAVYSDRSPTQIGTAPKGAPSGCKYAVYSVLDPTGQDGATKTISTAMSALCGFTFERISTCDGVPEENRPSYSEANPERTVTCDVTGSDGKVYSQSSKAYKETDGSMPAPECPALPEGVTPQKLDVATKTADGKSTPLQSQEATPAYKEAVKNYPECQTGLCTLDLVEVASDTSCFDKGETCNGWFKDPSKSTKYACYYGSHKLDLSKCNVYAQVFDPVKRAAGNPYAMPDGSDPEMQSTLTDGQKAFSEPVQDPTNVRTCIAEGVSMNPITWVQYPVQCALQWAFVPRPQKLRESSVKVTSSWDKTAPVELSNAVGGWDFKPMMTGCDGIAYPKDLIFPGMQSGRLGNACPGTPLAPAASFTSIILTILASVGAAFAVASYMGWTIGFRGPAES